MAANAQPLFVADLPTLKESLRLGRIIDEDAAAPILYDAMLRARTMLIRTLGDGPVANLAALPTTDSPTTRQEVQKVEAEQLEVVLVKRFLISDLPTAFMDDSGGMIDTYNQEAPFRLTNPGERMRWIKEMEVQANDLSRRLVTDLRAEETASDLSAGRKINGTDAVLTGPSDEAPLLTARDGYLTTDTGTAYPQTAYNSYRLWHRR